MEVRLISEREAPAYYALRVQSTEEMTQPAAPEIRRELAVGISRIADLIAQYPAEGTRVWGAFIGHLLVGAVALTNRVDTDGAHQAAVWGMYVRPEYRATLAPLWLMDALIAWSKSQRGMRKITSRITRDNYRARELFVRFGFSWVSTEVNPQHRGYGTCDTLHMERTL